MSSLREIAQDYIPHMDRQVAWLLLWKNGRKWSYTLLIPDDVDASGRPELDADERAAVLKALREDENAIALNPYWHNLGEAPYNREMVAAKLRWQYESGGGYSFNL